MIPHTNLAASILGRVDTEPYLDAAVVFGIVADGVTDNADALDAITAADVRVQFPAGVIGTSRTWFHNGKGFRGDPGLGTTIEALVGFTAADDLVSITGPGKSYEQFYDVNFHCQGRCANAFTTVDPQADNHSNPMFVNCGFWWGTEYALNFPTEPSVASAYLVGATFINCFFSGHFGGGNMYIGRACDDITFIGCRASYFSDPEVVPFFFDDTVNVKFFNFFLTVDDTNTGIESVFATDSGGGQWTFDGLFLEFNGKTFSELKYIFEHGGGPSNEICNVRLQNNPTNAFPTLSGFIKMNPGWGTGHLKLSNIVNGFNGAGINFDTLILVDHNTDTAGKYQYVTIDGCDTFANLAQAIDANVMSEPKLYLGGNWKGSILDHWYWSDGTNDHFARAPTGFTAIVTHVANYVAVFGDVGVTQRMNLGVANTYTVPLAATIPWMVGMKIKVRCVGAGTTTLTPTGAAVFNGNAVLTTNQVAELEYIGADVWDINR